MGYKEAGWTVGHETLSYHLIPFQGSTDITDPFILIITYAMSPTTCTLSLDKFGVEFAARLENFSSTII